MVTAIRNRWRRFRGLLAFGWFLGFFYGDSLRDYPIGVATKMILARLAFVLPLPLLLPDRHFLLKRRGVRMYKELNSCPIEWDVASGAYEYWKVRLFTDLVTEGMTILDIGANEGYYSMLFARLMHDKGRVLAFEPDPNNSHWLKKNISANGYQCIELHNYALSDREGETTFYPGGGVGSLVHQSTDLALLHEPRDPVTVRTRTLDNVLRDANIKNVDLMKIDVEGADLLVLKGAQHTLKTTNVRILMDIDVHGDERTELLELLRSCGFSLYRIGKELKLITLPPQPAKESQTKDCLISQPSSIRSRLTTLAPTGVKVMLSTLFYSYLCIPLRWVRSPRDVREIYATKTDSIAGLS